jgi:ABC-type glycerol-3-phosphate transport system permease component
MLEVFPARQSSNFASHGLLLTVCAVTLVPFYWMFATSLKPANEIFDLSPLPSHPTLNNYVYVWQTIPIGAMLATTFSNAVLQMLGQLVLATLTAYAFARWRFRGDTLLFLVFVGTWLVPFQATMIPNYVLLSRLGWLDSLAALVIPHLGSAFGIILLRQYMKGFPRELIDAAHLDGASSWAILWRVVVPNLRAPLAAVAVLSFITTWNEYFWPLLVTSKMERTVLQVGLQMFLTMEGDQWGGLMAGASMATIPLLVIYLILQRQVVEAFVRSGLR